MGVGRIPRRRRVLRPVRLPDHPAPARGARAIARIDIVRFWLRRVRRLFPALILVLLAVAAATALWTDPTQYRAVRGDALSGLFYVANWRFILAGQSYFDLFSAPSPLRHLWSLAIEEQFYLVWPLVLFACFRLAGGRDHDDAERRGRRAALGVCLGGIAVSAVLMAMWFVPGDPSRVDYGTDTWAQTILVGCVLALLTTRRPMRLAASRAASSVGAVAVIVMVAAFVFVADTDARIYRGGSLVFALIVACVLWYVTSRPSVVARALAVRPLVFIGTISYGLYLWHWPAIVFMTPANVHLSGWHLDAARIIVTFAAAVLSYRFVERPIRLSSSRVSTAWALAAIAAVAGLFLAVTAGAKPIPNYLGGQANPNGRCAEASPAALKEARSFYAASGQRIAADNPLRGKRILVVGDSTACSLVVGLQVVGEAYGATVGNGTVVGCGVVSGWIAGPFYRGTKICAAAVPQVEAAAFAEASTQHRCLDEHMGTTLVREGGHTFCSRDAGLDEGTQHADPGRS